VDELSAKQGEVEFECPSDEKRTPIYIIGMASDSQDTIGGSGSVLIDSSLELMKETERTIQGLARAIREGNKANDYLRQENKWHVERIDNLNQTLELHKSNIQYLQNCVHEIYSSRSWAAITRWCRFRDRAFPQDSLRRRLLYRILGGKR
jgi:hypothetical protein